MYRQMIVAAVAAFALSVTSIGLTATPAQAGWVEGWYTFYGTKTKTQTFHERSPLKTKFVMKLQKKKGAKGDFRAKVIIRKGPWRAWSDRFVKESRGTWDTNGGHADWQATRSRRLRSPSGPTAPASPASSSGSAMIVGSSSHTRSQDRRCNSRRRSWVFGCRPLECRLHVRFALIGAILDNR